MKSWTSFLPAALNLATLSGLLSSLVASSAAVPGDEHWDNRFGPVGLNDSAWALAIYRSNVYVGGTFTAAGNTLANMVAGYDGTNWFKLNNGIPNPSGFYVWGMTSDSNNLYVGGMFTNADNSGAAAVARWDGSNWYKMGDGLPGYLFSFTWRGTNLYAGGIFYNNLTSNYNCLARWDNTNWTIIPGNFGGSLPVVYCVESDGTNLFVGGYFSGIGGVTATNVAMWDGANWSTLGPGLNGAVWTLLSRGQNLYAGGTFTNASAGFTNLAVWTGSVWSAWANADRTVRDLLFDGTNIYAGGDFGSIGGISANRIARWNGVAWSALGSGVTGFGVGASPGVYAMRLDSNGRLVAAGNFNQIGGIGASHVGLWDGANWHGMGGATSKGLTHFVGTASAMATDGTNVYVGGIFTEAGDQIVNGLAKWDGTNWSSLGGLAGGLSGSTPSARALVLSGNGKSLYVGGNFTNAGGVAANGIAVWTRNLWSAFGSGADAPVNAIGLYSGNVYAGGGFTNIGGLSTPGFAVWLGSGWASLGLFAGGTRTVNAIAVDGTDMYVGGNFTSINGGAFTNIARFNGSSWVALGGGVNNTVNAIVASNGVVYVGGSFVLADGATVNRIAKWNGTAWSGVGGGVTGSSSGATVLALGFDGTTLYAGGTFSNASGVYVPGIAKWDGLSWSGFGSGLGMRPGTPSARSFALVGSDVYVGGLYSFAGDKPSMFIGRWNPQTNFYPPPHLQLTRPSVSTNGFSFRVSGTSGEQYVIQSSTNLSSWTALFTNSGVLYDYTDSSSTNASKIFYRSLLAP